MSSIRRFRSNWLFASDTSTSSLVTPGASKAPSRTFCSANSTWTSGLRERSRSGASSATSLPNGTSWWAKEASALSVTRRTNSSNPGSPCRSSRTGTVFRKQPTRSSNSARSRLATGVPTSRWSWPV